MAANSSARIHRRLADWGRGNKDAGEALIPVVYNLGISPATAKREWMTARAWLRRELKRHAAT